MGERRRPCTRCGKNRADRFYVSARGRVCVDCQRSGSRRRARATRINDTYGITLDEYSILFADQGKRCAICRGTRSGNLDIDHDRAAERRLLDSGVSAQDAARRSIRGLLCKRCNRRLLPAAVNDVSILVNAQSYLIFQPARTQQLLQLSARDNS